eukprot:3379125-Prymnesium_polylepis.1
MMLLVRSYSRVGSAEAAARKFALLTLQRAAGRSAETAWLTWDGLKWDSYFGHAFGEWPQPKGSKVKLAAFGAGRTRHSDWFLHLGDFFIMQADRQIYSATGPAWVFPKLQKTKSPGTTVGNYIRDLQPAARGGADAYQDKLFVLPQLPPSANAGGIRPGVCNMLNAAMPADFAVNTTAHDLTKTSAFFEYVDATRAGCMPGSVVLGDWPALPWGHMGMGPKPPSLAPLMDMGVSQEQLDTLIDEIFRLDSATCPLLWREGSLRPMVEAAFASELMYFEERRTCSTGSEMEHVLKVMLDELRALSRAEGGIELCDGDAAATICRWGEAIKLQFDLDNFHLTARSVDTNSAQMVAALQGLGRTVGNLHAQVASLQRQIKAQPTAPAAAATPSRGAPASPTAVSPPAPVTEPAPSPASALSQAFNAAASAATPAAPPAQPGRNPFNSMMKAGKGSTPLLTI